MLSRILVRSGQEEKGVHGLVGGLFPPELFNHFNHNSPSVADHHEFGFFQMGDVDMGQRGDV